MNLLYTNELTEEGEYPFIQYMGCQAEDDVQSCLDRLNMTSGSVLLKCMQSDVEIMADFKEEGVWVDSPMGIFIIVMASLAGVTTVGFIIWLIYWCVIKHRRGYRSVEKEILL